MSFEELTGSCSDGIVICFLYLKERAQGIGGLAQKTMGTSDCGTSSDEECRDKQAALYLKTIAIFVILVMGASGVALPLLGRKLNFIRTSGNFFVIAKAFAAGVILATGFVHMLSDAEAALTDQCLPDMPWSKFPFSGFIAMLATLCTLLADFLGTQYYEKKHLKEQNAQNGVMSIDHIEEQQNWPELMAASSVEDGNEKMPDDEHGDRHMHIVGMRAHAASHSHSHPHGHHSCEDETHEHVHKQFGHTHNEHIMPEPSQNIRHIVVSQVLEMGIVSHSVIIGLSLGVSQSPCTVRPLMGALCFHQFFEGFALGGCVSQVSFTVFLTYLKFSYGFGIGTLISVCAVGIANVQAGFKSLSATIMASFFAVTTPAGIGIGIGISSIYNPNSPRALVVEGIFDSISAGILIYMALVDLIAADFLSKGMCCNPRLQIVSYIALIVGGLMMSSLAIWA